MEEEGKESKEQTCSPETRTFFFFPHACAFNFSLPGAHRAFVLLQLQLFLFAAAAVVLKGLFSHGMLSN